MALTVLSVAYPLAPVGPDAVGGAEQVLTMLDRALVEAGHRSLVVAPEGSTCAGELIATPKLRDSFEEDELARAQERHREAIARALERHRVDVVHLHGIDFDRYLPESGPPVLATLHLPPSWYRPEAFARRGRVLLNCVSNSQQQACPPGAVAEVLPNGVPVESFRMREKKAGFVLALGRICPEKGFHLAMEASRRAGLPFVLAGRVFPYEAHQRYFAEVLAPLLDEARLFIGPAGFARKRRLLAAARCLVVPSQAPETSSLVAMEALASGTPVVAWRIGALPEIVEHGRTGFLVDSVEELEDALRRVNELDPRECRRAAEERFDASVMSRRYLATYEKLAGKRARLPRTTVADELSTRESTEALRPAWEALWRRSPAATVFSHPEWLLAWWRAFAPEAPRVVAIRRGDQLVGLVPLIGWKQGDSRVLGLMGGGVSDVQDALFEPGAETAFAGWIRDTRASWDRIELDQLRPDSPLLSFDAGPVYSRVDDFGASPMMPLDLADEAFRRRDVPYYRRRLARTADARFEAATEETLGEFVDALFALHEARWKARGEPGVLADSRPGAFHRDAIRRLFTGGFALLRGIRVEGRLVAVSYTLADRTALRFYITGFDPAYSRVDPGTLLVADAMDEARRRGLATFDFLRGREPYKYAWGATDVAHARRVIAFGDRS